MTDPEVEGMAEEETGEEARRWRRRWGEGSVAATNELRQ